MRFNLRLRIKGLGFVGLGLGLGLRAVDLPSGFRCRISAFGRQYLNLGSH